MYNVNRITQSYLPLIGWRQQTDPGATQIDPVLTVSESGLFYQDEHPVLTLDNLLAISPDFSLIVYPAWSEATAYSVDNIVKKGTVIYRCIKAGTNQDPAAAASEYWKVEFPFSTWLKEKTEAAIIRAIQYWLETKQGIRAARGILQDAILFDGGGVVSNTIPNALKWAGLEFEVKRDLGTVAKVGKIGFQFSENVTFNLYLFHSSSPEAISTTEIAYDKTGEEKWFDVNFELPYRGDFKGGSYYVVYKQSDLGTAKAINRIQGYSASDMGTYDLKGLWGKYVSIHPFNVAETTGLWDIRHNEYNYGTNYGMNIAMSVYCEYTDFLIEQRLVFKNLVAKQVATSLLREIAYNPSSRVGRNETTIERTQLLYEIDGDSQGRPGGMQLKLEQAAAAVNITTEGLNRLCLPCKKAGVRYKSI